MKVGWPRTPRRRCNKWFSQTLDRHRCFWPPLKLQRQGNSTTLAAATSLFSSPMFMKRLPNSLFHIFSKIIKNVLKTFFLRCQIFFNGRKHLEQTSKVQTWIWGEITKSVFDMFGVFINLDFYIIHIFHCLGSHAEGHSSIHMLRAICFGYFRGVSIWRNREDNNMLQRCRPWHAYHFAHWWNPYVFKR